MVQFPASRPSVLKAFQSLPLILRPAWDPEVPCWACKQNAAAPVHRWGYLPFPSMRSQRMRGNGIKPAPANYCRHICFLPFCSRPSHSVLLFPLFYEEKRDQKLKWLAQQMCLFKVEQDPQFLNISLPRSLESMYSMAKNGFLIKRLLSCLFSPRQTCWPLLRPSLECGVPVSTVKLTLLSLCFAGPRDSISPHPHLSLRVSACNMGCEGLS